MQSRNYIPDLTTGRRDFKSARFMKLPLIIKTIHLLRGSQCVVMANVVGYGDDFFTTQNLIYLNQVIN